MHYTINVLWIGRCSMFTHIEEKLKFLEKLYVVCLTVLGVLVGGTVYSLYEEVHESSVTLCLALIVFGGGFGFGIGYIGAIFIYGLGELIDYTRKINEKMEVLEDDPQHE